jgi:hypothetical protein
MSFVHFASFDRLDASFTDVCKSFIFLFLYSSSLSLRLVLQVPSGCCHWLGVFELVPPGTAKESGIGLFEGFALGRRPFIA